MKRGAPPQHFLPLSGKNLIALFLLLFIFFVIFSVIKILDSIDDLRTITTQAYTGEATGTVQLEIESSSQNATTPGPTGGTGGRGRQGAAFLISDPTTLSLNTIASQPFITTFTLRNQGDLTITYSVTTTLNNLITIPTPPGSSLAPGQDQPITLIITAPTPDVYTGEIRVNTPYGTLLIPIIITAHQSTYDSRVTLTIHETSTTIRKGGDLTFTVTLEDLPPERYTISYTIKDHENKQYYKETQTVAVNQHTTYDHAITIPPLIGEGNYILYITVTQGERTFLASDTFDIVVRLPQLEEPRKLFEFGRFKGITITKKTYYTLVSIITGLMILSYALYYHSYTQYTRLRRKGSDL